ncbi:MAG TPA: tetratricopeptide repeat protein [Chloroflexia bacterium]|nr:tetratricopeptide repeat protein [Chloroflexia bacterium]
MNDLAPSTNTFGRWLKERRQSFGLTQTNLADKAACAPSMIEKIERGLRRPSHQVAERIAEVLRIPEEERKAFVEWARGLPSDYLSTVPLSRPRSQDQDAESAPPSPPPGQPISVTAGSGYLLPAPVTATIGREHDLERARDILCRADVRLLTLVGPPGIGKTRLSLELASSLRDDFADGIRFIPLAPLRDPRLLAATIAASLDLKGGDHPISETLKDYLRSKQMLLVLDNFEQLIEAAPFVAELLEVAPGLKVVVTSRALLHIYGEHEYPVPPLELPDLRNLPPAEALAQTASVDLFVQRAQAASHTFRLTPDNATYVAGICVSLDGLPLAIELAAARSKIFTPQVLLKQMESRLTVLTGGPKDRDPRQRTLRGAIAWSYDLLNSHEQALFRRLSVFVGGWTSEAATAIATYNGWGAEVTSSDAMDTLSSLVDKSLLRVEEIGDEIRFGMLETIREYASGQAQEAGETEMLQRRHAEYYLALAEQIGPALRGHEQAAALARLDREYDNVRAVLAWAVERGEGEIAQAIPGAIWRFWTIRGYISEGRSWLAKALAMPPRRTATWARAANAGGNLAQIQVDYVEARALHEETRAVYIELGDKAGTARALNNLGVSAWQQGDYLAARSFFQECLDLQREVGSDWDVAAALTNLGLVLTDEGAAYGEALEYHQEALLLFRKVGDRKTAGAVQNNMGVLLRHEGKYEEARTVWEEYLELTRGLRDKTSTALALSNLALVARDEGRYADAHLLSAESIGLCREIGDRRIVAHILSRLGGQAVLTGDPARAGRLFGAVEMLTGQIGAKLPPAIRKDQDHFEAIAQNTLGEVYKAAWEEGNAFSFEQAVAFALSKSD